MALMILSGQDNYCILFLHIFFMTTTMFIAQLLLPVFAAVTISMFINPKRFKQIARNIADMPALTYLVSMINLIGGTAILLYHNIRAEDLSVAITIIGWLMIIKWAVYILFPKSIRHVAAMVENKTTIYVIGVVAAVITVILFSLSGLR